jgi:hypothetical protein
MLRDDNQLFQSGYAPRVRRLNPTFDCKQGVQKGGNLQPERSLILHLFKHLVGTVTPNDEFQVRALSLPQLEALGKALLDFSEPDDLGD